MDYETTSMDKAIFLMCRKKELLSINDNKVDIRRKIFVFEDAEGECIKLINAYDYGLPNNENVMIDGRDWSANSKKIKQLLHEI